MVAPELKNVCPIHQSRFVTVPSDTWNELCSTLNTMIDVLNTHDAALESCKTNLSKIAKITEEMYENLA